jgi:hypothetical protein
MTESRREQIQRWLNDVHGVSGLMCELDGSIVPAVGLVGPGKLRAEPARLDGEVVARYRWTEGGIRHVGRRLPWEMTMAEMKAHKVEAEVLVSYLRAPQ